MTVIVCGIPAVRVEITKRDRLLGYRWCTTHRITDRQIGQELVPWASDQPWWRRSVAYTTFYSFTGMGWYRNCRLSRRLVHDWVADYEENIVVYHRDRECAVECALRWG